MFSISLFLLFLLFISLLRYLKFSTISKSYLSNLTILFLQPLQFRPSCVYYLGSYSVFFSLFLLLFFASNSSNFLLLLANIFISSAFAITCVVLFITVYFMAYFFLTPSVTVYKYLSRSETYWRWYEILTSDHIGANGAA